MTISNTQVRVNYVGDGSSTSFPIPFPFYLATDLLVILAGTALSAGYSVSGGSGSTGTLVMASAPTSGQALQIVLNVPFTQLVNLVDGTSFPSATLNQVNDRSVQAILRLADRLSRSMAAPDGDLNPSVSLPPANQRANKYLTFDANGNLSLAAGVSSVTLTSSAIAGTLDSLKQTPAEAALNVVPISGYAPGNILRYCTTSEIVDIQGYTYSLDVSAAVRTALSVSQSVYGPTGGYRLDSSVTINPKQNLIGDGLGRTIFKYTPTTGNALSLPLYGGNEATVEYGGNTLSQFTIQGAGAGNSTIGLYIKNKTDCSFEHLEITGFGKGVSGARDNVANSCTSLTFNACRIQGNGINLYAPLSWNGLVINGGSYINASGWGIVLYDAIQVRLNIVAQNGGAAGSVYLGGCKGSIVTVYTEGSQSNAYGAAVCIVDSKDVTGSSSNSGIPMGTSRANHVTGSTFTSASGIAYGCVIDGGIANIVDGNYGGSGLGSAVIRVTSGTAGNFFGANWSNPGTNVVYDTPSDQANNFEMSISSGVASLPAVSTDAVYIDNADTSDTATLSINMIGYQGGVTKYRRLNIGDGRNNVLFQVDGQGQLVNLIASKVFAAALPTTNPGPGTGQLWVNGGVVTRA